MSERRVRPGGERNKPSSDREQKSAAALAAVPELEIGGVDGVQPIIDEGDY